MLSCARYRKRLGAFLDGELPGRQAAAVADHAAKCPACRQALAELRVLGADLAAFAVPEPPAELTARIVAAARLRRRSEEVGWKGILFGEPFRFWPWTLKAASAAALLFGLGAGSFLGWTAGPRGLCLCGSVQTQTSRPAQDLYALDAFAGAPGGSLEAATLALIRNEP
jgi:anti-sigma factor RsiW